MDVDSKRMAVDDCGLLLVGINVDGRGGADVAMFVGVRLDVAMEGTD